MNRKFVVGLVALMGIAMVCIVLIQLFWIQHAYHEIDDRFRVSVTDALERVAGRLEEQENYSMISKNIRITHTGPPDIPPPPAGQRQAYTVIYKENDSRSKRLQPDKPVRFEKTMTVRDMDNIVTVVINDSVNKSRIQSSSFSEKQIDSILELIPGSKGDPGSHKKVRGMMNVFNQMVIEASTENLPVEKRVDQQLLRDEMRKFMNNKGIDLPFEYAVMEDKTDSLTSLHSPGFQKKYSPSPFRVSLFTHDFNLKPYKLLVYFPGRRAFIYHSFYWLLLSSVLFTLLIILSFAYTVHLLLKQKKLADVKSDFINNLTHEFKTPIATISVALDSIENSKVISHPEKILPITRMIREENRRMNDHVEQVLQMALLDNGKLSLSNEVVEMDVLLQRAAEAIGIQLERKSGSVLLELNADDHRVKGDEMHLYNVFLNLLDNAAKYSAGTPEIRLETSRTGQCLVIGVEDHGIGMSREVRKKIFEQFYRLPTGNIHNVKGFGLGLSYARAIVEAHSGTIAVSWSEPGKGSRLEVSLPLWDDQV